MACTAWLMPNWQPSSFAADLSSRRLGNLPGLLLAASSDVEACPYLAGTGSPGRLVAGLEVPDEPSVVCASRLA